MGSSSSSLASSSSLVASSSLSKPRRHVKRVDPDLPPPPYDEPLSPDYQSSAGQFTDNTPLLILTPDRNGGRPGAFSKGQYSIHRGRLVFYARRTLGRGEALQMSDHLASVTPRSIGKECDCHPRRIGWTF